MTMNGETPEESRLVFVLGWGAPWALQYTERRTDDELEGLRSHPKPHVKFGSP